MSTVNWQVTHDRTEGIRLLQRGAAGGSRLCEVNVRQRERGAGGEGTQCAQLQGDAVEALG